MAAATSDPLAPLRQGDPGPLYWVYGKEHFLVDRAIALLKERVLDPRTRDFNLDLLYAKEVDPQRVLVAARTLPMMARRRLILVRDADGFDAKELEALAPYIADPAPESCVVFVAEKADQRLKFFTAFKKRGVVLKLDPLSDRQLGPFVRGEAAARGIKFDPGAAELLAEEVGAELGPLADAVERVALYVGERRSANTADVEAVVTTSRQRTVFELCDAIGTGDRARAFSALGSLLGAREPALRILAMIGRTVRQLIAVRELLDRRAGRSAILERLGLPPFIVEKIEGQAARFDAAALRRMHRAIYRTDRALKSSRLDDERVMELLVLDLVRERSEGRSGKAGARRSAR